MDLQTTKTSHPHHHHPQGTAMKASLRSHDVLADCEDHGHGSAPGDTYSHARVVVSSTRGRHRKYLLGEGRYRAYVCTESGSDQGADDGSRLFERAEHYEACGRGTTVALACDAARAELVELGQYTYAARSALASAVDEVDESTCCE